MERATILVRAKAMMAAAMLCVFGARGQTAATNGNAATNDVTRTIDTQRRIHGPFPSRPAPTLCQTVGSTCSLHSDDKKRARLNCIHHILDLIPCNKVPREKVKLPKRSMLGAYDDQATLNGRDFVPEKY